jgi:RNA-directed DNA polymerase
MIEQILNPRNIRRACKAVVSNKGSAGVDGMSVKELPTHLKSHRDAIVKVIRSGSYISQPILGVEIPKDDGTQRLLGVPKLLSYYLFTVYVRDVSDISKYQQNNRKFNFN